jgi:hypothetical protein
VVVAVVYLAAALAQVVTPQPSPTPSPSAPSHEIDANLEYESQYADVIFNGSARHDLSAQGAVLPYAELIVGYDTRSAAPGLGEVYNENAVIPSFGFRAPFGEEQYGELFVQGGYSFGLRGQLSFPETRWGFDYSRDYGSSFSSAYPHAEVNGNVAVYSRFAGNLIGSLDAYFDARLAQSLRALAGTVISFDDHREYGNNYAEAYAGFMVPFSPVLDLRLAGVEGTYLSRGIDVPKPASYSSFRVTLTHSSPP